MRLIKGVKIKNISSDGKYLKYLFKSKNADWGGKKNRN